MPSGGPDPAPRTWRRWSGRSGWEVGETSAPPSSHRPGDGLDIDQKRLVLGRLDVGVADIGRERIRPEPLARCAGESPMQRNADDVHRLAVAGELPDALGDDGLRLHRAAVRPHADPRAGLDALLLRELFTNLNEEFRLHHSIGLDVL